MNHKNLFAAASLGLLLGACATNAGTNDQASGTATASVPTGECHGINACKGKGDCGGKGHGCAGKNACKGQGWKKMTEADCKAKKGKFKA